MKPMLARTYGPKFNSFPCFVQPKLNGVRALYQNGVFQSRDEKLWKPGVLAHLIAEMSAFSSSTVFDGELYVHDWRLQRINGAIAVNRLEPNADTPNVCFHIFDIVDTSRSFSYRWFDYYQPLIQADLPHVKAVPTALVSSRDELDQRFHQYTALGYEGIMLRPDGPYEFGEHKSERTGGYTSYRSKTLWKHKQWSDAEFMCVGITQGDGKAEIGVGALICAAITNPHGLSLSAMQMDDMPTFKVGTGFEDSERIAFATDPPIGKLIRVRYLELTADGIPFNSSFLCVMP